MEVKLSISSSRRISFASDFKDIDLEVEELENERDNPSYRRSRSVNYNSDSDDDDVESNYVNESGIFDVCECDDDELVKQSKGQIQL